MFLVILGYYEVLNTQTYFQTINLSPKRILQISTC